MATQRNPKGASEFLDTVHTLSVESEEEILSMSQEQVRTRLTEEGIDLSSAKTDLASRMKVFRGQQKLVEARERRMAQESLLAERKATTLLNADQMRAEIEQRLGLMPMPNNASAPVHAYFNRFKEAADEDMPGLLDDLKVLEEQNTES